MVVAGALGAAAFVGVVKTAADFEKTMSAVGAVSNASEKDMGRLRDTALDLGIKTAYSSQEVAGAMEDLAKAGLTVDEIVGGAAKATTTLAAAAGDELPGGIAQGAEIIANAMKTFDASAGDMNHFADVLVGAAASSTINVEDMATSLKYAGPIAHTLGIDIDGLSTALAILGDRGIKGSTAGTSLRGVLLSLSPTSKKAAATMKDLGLITENGTNLFFDMHGALKPLPEIMQLLQDKTKGLSQEEKVAAFNQIFQRRAMNSALILAEQGAKGYDRYAQSIGKISASDIAKKKLDNLSGALKILKSSVNALLIQAGTPLLEMITGWVRHLTKFINSLARLDPHLLTTILKIVGIASAILLVLGAGVMFLSMMLKMYRAFKDVTMAIQLMGNMLKVSFLTNPVFLVVAAIVALGVAFYLAYKKSKSFRNFVDGLARTFMDVIKPLQPLFDRLKLFGHYVAILVKALASGKMTAQAFANMMGTLTQVLTGNQTAAKFVHDMMVKFTNVLRKVWEWGAKVQAKIDFGKVFKVLGFALFTVMAPLIALPIAFLKLYRSNEKFRNGVKALIDWLKTNFLPLFHDIGELFKALLAIITTVGRNIVPIVKAWVRLIVTDFKWLLGVAKDIWRLLGDNIISLVKIAFNFIRSQISAALRVIRGIIQVVTGLIHGDWGEVWGGIQKIFSGIWAGIVSILKTALQLVVLAIQTVVDMIHVIWDAGWNFIKDVVPAVFNLILQVIKKAGSAIWQLVLHIVKMLVAPFVWLYDFLLGNSIAIIPRLMITMKNIIKSGLEAIRRFFTELPGKVVSALASLAGKLLTLATNALGFMLTGAREGFTHLYNWVTMIPGKILSGIGNLGSVLLEAGKSVIQGLWNGMKDIWKDVEGWLGGLADKFPIKKGPPPKDAKILIPAGRLIMQGLNRGLSQGWDDVEKNLESMTTLMSKYGLDANGQTSTLRGVGTATQGHTINVTLEFPITTPETEGAIKTTMQETQFLPTLIRGIRAGVGSNR